jgi:hypothetical protein
MPLMRTAKEAYEQLFTVVVPQYNYALEWDIVANRQPDVIDDHQRREFVQLSDFDEYRATIGEAEGEGMVKNVRLWHRQITVGPWTEGLA